MRVFYIDEYLLINLAANYLLLLLTAELCGLCVSRLRLAAGAGIGAAYAAFDVLYGVGFLASPLFRLLVAAGMVAAAFGGTARLTRAFAVCMLVAMALGGIVYALSMLLPTGSGGGMRLEVLAVSFLCSYLTLKLIFQNAARSKKGGGIVPVTVTVEGTTVRFHALVDTGNSLRDPVTGRAVLIADYAAVRSVSGIGGLGKNLLQNPADAVEVLKDTPLSKRLRLVPYAAVGRENGLLLAFRPDSVVVGDRKRSDFLVAVSPTPVSDGGAYAALVGTEP